LNEYAEELEHDGYSQSTAKKYFADIDLPVVMAKF
jgi:hypothetical protein